MGYIFRFGKHKGRDINDVPEDYLLWLYDQNEEVQQAIRSNLNIPANKPAHNNNAGVFEKVKKLRREMAKMYHPDLGGSDDAMRAVNCVFDRLMDLIK